MSFSGSFDLIKEFIDWAHEQWLYGYNNAKNVIQLYGDVVSKLSSTIATQQTSDIISAVQSSIDASRSSNESALKDLITGLEASFLTLVQEIDFNETSFDDAFKEAVVQYMIDNAETVKSRAYSRGVMTADVGNTGDGEILTMADDINGYDCELGLAGKTVIKCVNDVLNGAVENSATFKIFMEGAIAKDELDNPDATKDETNITAVTCDDNAILQNPDFSSYNSAGDAYTKFTNWILSDKDYFIQEKGDPTAANVWKKKRATVSTVNPNGVGYALEIVRHATPATSHIAKQEMITGSLNKEQPYMIYAKILGEAGKDDTVKLHIGSQVTPPLTVSAAWQTLSLAKWLPSFDASPLEIKIERISGTTAGTSGIVWVSNLVFIPMSFYNNMWQAAFGGQADFLLDDLFHITDTGGTTGIIQLIIAKLLDWYLPHQAAPSIADPT